MSVVRRRRPGSTTASARAVGRPLRGSSQWRSRKSVKPPSRSSLRCSPGSSDTVERTRLLPWRSGRRYRAAQQCRSGRQAGVRAHHHQRHKWTSHFRNTALEGSAGDQPRVRAGIGLTSRSQAEGVIACAREPDTQAADHHSAAGFSHLRSPGNRTERRRAADRPPS
jgi:hypothetical protein